MLFSPLTSPHDSGPNHLSRVVRHSRTQTTSGIQPEEGCFGFQVWHATQELGRICREKAPITSKKNYALYVPALQIPRSYAQQDVLKLGDFGSCRSVYSKQPYTEYISTRWYRAPECLLTDGFYSSRMDLWSAGCVFFEIASLQPLFPGANELDQISKIHDVVGTPAEKTLTKFKQSRAMSFDFPFKKGSGIPLLTADLSPQCLSLLHAMVTYDPDERVTAQQALKHPCFQGQRATERQALGSHRKAFFPECPESPEPLCNRWWISKEGRKQQQPLKQEVGCPKRQGPACLTELPTLKLPGVTQLSYSSPALQSVFGLGGNRKVPELRPLKCVGANQKTDMQKDVTPDVKQYRLPAIGRNGGGR
ncbi:MAPK/MAK/MRK overlapping kinase isoform 10-T10 [Hipposideros larvatus]